MARSRVFRGGFFFGSLVLFDRDRRRERREGERGVKINNFFFFFLNLLVSQYRVSSRPPTRPTGEVRGLKVNLPIDYRRAGA